MSGVLSPSHATSSVLVRPPSPPVNLNSTLKSTSSIDAVLSSPQHVGVAAGSALLNWQSEHDSIAPHACEYALQKLNWARSSGVSNITARPAPRAIPDVRGT